MMLDELDHVFDDHPSLDASLEDFENNSSPRPSPVFGLPSQHSGFRAEESDGEDEATPNGEVWSPPGDRRYDFVQGSGWYRHSPYTRKFDEDRPTLKPTVGLSPSQSREPSPQYEDAMEAPTEVQRSVSADTGDVTLAANVPLPTGAESPLKGRSPSPVRGAETSPGPEDVDFRPENNISNYIRFAVRAEVQHREPFVAFFGYLRSKFDNITSSKSSTILSAVALFLSLAIMHALFLPSVPQSIPDLVKLSGFARSFEPLIHYSENGVQHIGALQETGVAVWDLSESVRGTNMTSAPIIVGQLDELSDSLKSLSLELTRFFANVDSDVDSILIVMDWAKRELEALSSQPPSSLPTIVFDNVHDLLAQLGTLEQVAEPSSGDEGGTSELTTTPTTFGNIVTTIFGQTAAQRTRSALTRTFTEFLSVLEESINSELTHSTALFALFESIDRQFLNLQRTVVRESDAQERAEGEMLSSLWTRVLGPNAAVVRKYEKNKRLLASVRSRTVANKHLLMDHRGRLLTLKVNLETLRRKLVSPLVRRNDSVSFVGALDSGRSNGRLLGPVEAVIEGQIRGLEGSYDYLRTVRDKQKAKLMEMVYGSGRKLPSTLLPETSDEGETIEG
ncbi:hypothetical protein P168DRAFT_53653 [Aspergillus campestris IBT 28561]|uniref:Uncharacterized protein n=1 Tax=Aspergillus campestris (strain IBT 28561) TaxID=1392248 RepID=A0A2I1CVJ5_ASPC2|nr:uncharacterized protein P168DRAFT_53653 [Aspergillus campestris IBT 28561]PKY01648.1 hypothetical protein P168DRAFT_53653 [Aspergillus campestris IBT 28561]